MSTTARTIRRTNTTLTVGTWFLIAGVIGYSLMTTTPFVAAHSAWSWSGPALGTMTDVAFVMALQAESVLSRHGVAAAELKGWPMAFRWFTGLATVFLNVWHSVETNDPVGIAVHLIAPCLLMLVAEVSPIYRRLLAQLLEKAEGTERDTLIRETVPVTFPAPVQGTVTVSNTLPVEEVPATVQDTPKPLVICGGHRAWDLSVPVAVPPYQPVPEVDTEEKPRLSTTQARAVIQQGWTEGNSIRETARSSTRSPSYVQRVFRELDDEKGARPVAGQLALVDSA